MKTPFAAEADSKSSRLRRQGPTEDLSHMALGDTLEKRSLNPELLFAGAYSACYHIALVNAAKTLGTPVKDNKTRAVVRLATNDKSGYGLAVELRARLPELDREQARRVMEEAHEICLYSRALRGEASFALVLD
jgi:Ohr subfamily peroxiredoxin